MRTESLVINRGTVQVTSQPPWCPATPRSNPCLQLYSPSDQSQNSQGTPDSHTLGPLLRGTPYCQVRLGLTLVLASWSAFWGPMALKAVVGFQALSPSYSTPTIPRPKGQDSLAPQGILRVWVTMVLDDDA